MEKLTRNQVAAFQGAVRLAAGLSLEALVRAGWSLESLLNAMDAVQGVSVEPNPADEGEVKVTFQTDAEEPVDADLLERLADEGDLPLFLWMVSHQSTEAALA